MDSTKFEYDHDNYRIYDSKLGIHILEDIPARMGYKIAKALNVAYQNGFDDAEWSRWR